MTRVTPLIVQRLDVGGIGTQRVLGDDALEMRVILAKRGNETLGGMAFTIIFLRTVLLHNRFGHERTHFPNVRMDNGGAQHRVIRGDGAVAVDLVQA